MSLWQFQAAVDGYRKAHSAEPDASDLSGDELRDLADFIDQPPIWVH